MSILKNKELAGILKEIVRDKVNCCYFNNGEKEFIAYEALDIAGNSRVNKIDSNPPEPSHLHNKTLKFMTIDALVEWLNDRLLDTVDDTGYILEVYSFL